MILASHCYNNVIIIILKLSKLLLVGITERHTSFVSVNLEGISFTLSGTLNVPLVKRRMDLKPTYYLHKSGREIMPHFKHKFPPFL
jgi:hypothetical protein